MLSMGWKGEKDKAIKGNVKKDDLISKILARAASGHSEQFAILDL